ncbi:hypothetical protein RFI_25100 [Reticulomyxa filosa]|uniref:Uncharacterized protein n=1 Tax=Reticulomyxa filosa TaxID=46433 RepID=X6MGV0_RETFI|nr:hypothetical protein RFI_25100 [Reticulomyxa filosa]|eukprot:ETO12275.1 hypothetical protein RFI_25100 [Reticulomyxa filosa]
MASAKAKQAGKVLAESIINGDHGRRPITLIGWSLGGRVIFYCLLELVRHLWQCTDSKEEKKNTTASSIETAKKSVSDYLQLSNLSLMNRFGFGVIPNQSANGENTSTLENSNSIQNQTEEEKEKKKESQNSNANQTKNNGTYTMDMICGMIENVILIGAPCTADEKKWKWIRSHIVADRIINCYSQSDWVLKFVYRTNDMTHKVCGLEPIANVVGIENVDLSQMISGHAQYFHKPKTSSNIL